MYCCGKERITKFCPDCGRALVQNSIYQLLAHVTARAKMYAKQANERNTDNYYDKEHLIKNKEKWEAWEKTLRELIQKNENSPRGA